MSQVCFYMCTWIYELLDLHTLLTGITQIQLVRLSIESVNSANEFLLIIYVLMAIEWLSVIGGQDYWNELLEWTTGMDFDLFFFFFFSLRANYIH